MPRGTLEIEVYEPPSTLVSTHIENTAGAPITPGRGLRVTRDKAPPYVVGATGVFVSLLLHALFITSLIWGGSRAAPMPARQAIGVSNKMESEFTMELDLIDEPDSSAVTAVAAVGTPTLAPVPLKAALTLSNTPLLSDPDDSKAEPTEADAPAHSALVGRYLGQIDARIERAWLRPRTSVAEGLFSCQVRIEQSPRGDVKEITLERCNGDGRWQVSLVHAIQLASPLPAPPDPTVFSRVIRMNFRSMPYSARTAEDGYEAVRQ